MKNKDYLTVVTNNVEILNLLSNSRAKVISSGGMLCEGEKVGNRWAYKQCLLSDVDYLVCDKDLSEKFANTCKLL